MQKYFKNPENKTIIFLVLTIGISYLAACLFYFSEYTYTSIHGIVFGVFYMFIPAISTLIVEKLIHKADIISQLNISFKFNKWFVVSWILPPILAFLTFGISLLFPDVSYSADMEGMFERFSNTLSPEQMEQMRNSMDTLPIHPIWITLAQGIFAGLTVNAIAGFGEELGWRGFLVKQFGSFHFVRVSLLIGFIWGIWHAPIILMGHNYPEHPLIGVVLMIIWCILLSPVFLYILIKSRSVIAAAMMHGTLNGTAGIAILMVQGGNDLTVGITGLAGFIALMMVIALIFIFDRYISKEKILWKKVQKSLENPQQNDL
jgi:uncharacterized protein